MANGTLEIKAISGHAGPVPGTRHVARLRCLQADRCDDLHRLQGWRSRLPGVERYPFREMLSTTPTRPCRIWRGITTI